MKRKGYQRAMNFQDDNGKAKAYQVRQLLDALRNWSLSMSDEGRSPRYGIRVLWSDEDQCFIATCPDQDLSAFGPSREEAAHELEEPSSSQWPHMNPKVGSFNLRACQG
jgi:hypothetical protein